MNRLGFTKYLSSEIPKVNQPIPEAHLLILGRVEGVYLSLSVGWMKTSVYSQLIVPSPRPSLLVIYLP